MSAPGSCAHITILSSRPEQVAASLSFTVRFARGLGLLFSFHWVTLSALSLEEAVAFMALHFILQGLAESQSLMLRLCWLCWLCWLCCATLWEEER